MTKKERAKLLVEGLKKEYPDAVCSLVAGNPFELLVATRLSAQCTDARVNLVTPALFNKYRTLDDYVNADVKDIEDIIHSCGFYHGKARDIIEMARGVRDRFGGVVPDNIEDLTTLSGVGRKTANLIVGDVYGKPAVVADVHLTRIKTIVRILKEYSDTNGHVRVLTDRQFAHFSVSINKIYTELGLWRNATVKRM